MRALLFFADFPICTLARHFRDVTLHRNHLEKPGLIDPGKQARLTPESKISLTPFE